MDTELFARRLEQLKAEVSATVELSEAGTKPVELDQNRVGRLSRMDAMQAQAMAQANALRQAQLLVDIKKAQHRLSSGEFGVCIDCGEMIARARLEANLTVLYCIKCASAQES